MNKRAKSIFVIISLIICLIGGCSSFSEKGVDIRDWRELLSLAPDKSSTSELDDTLDNENSQGDLKPGQELIEVKLYFVGPDGNSLVAEKRTIVKTQSMARRTLEELIKGPIKEENLPAIPEGTRLRDINLKPDGLCIVDLSSEARHTGSAQQEKLMVYAIANTLGQFSTVKDVQFMIDGEMVEAIAGYLDLSDCIKPDYNI
ncbi:MAG: GerMN domain-containing protein [Syntrophomonadaceae bacterium]|jgi:germination protein M